MRLVWAAAVALVLGVVGRPAQASDLSWVTCGSSIKLAHAASGYRLHSHGVGYSHGSKQQSVTAFPEGDNAGGFWVLHGPADAPCQPGSPIAKKQRVRLQHAETRRWLHSHAFQSPLSGSQEVSAFGGDAQTDGGDVWSVVWDGKAKFWKQDAKVAMQHVDTSVFLHSFGHAAFGHPIAGQREVCGVKQRGPESEWFAAEGLYLPRADKKPRGTGAADGGGGGGSSGDGHGGSRRDEL